ncbi:MAG: hypothetical protein WDO15_09575 [Bacteroidota bacterium]
MLDGIFIQDLKLRGGYGKLGNTNAILTSNPSNQYALYQGNASTAYDINGTNGTGNAADLLHCSPATRRLSGRQAQQLTSASMALIMDGSLEVIFEIWQRNTSNLLFNPSFLNSGGCFT